MQRRLFVKTLLLLTLPVKSFSAGFIELFDRAEGNFKKIYSSITLKKEFYKFLENVFNLYPEDKMHKLISDTTIQKKEDRDIYVAAQSKLDDISPFLSTFKYKLPSLFKQKDEMAKETLQLLGEGSAFDGYLEIGSSGRYLDYLEEKIEIKGERYYADGKEPSYSVVEMVDRGQVAIGATYIPMADYRTMYSKIIPNGSLDLVTVYIGFHHCPLDLRVPFVSSIRDTMRVGGKLILRDHDCDTEEQKVLVALAHDVFNLGTNASWEYNSKEIRNFYSLEFIQNFVEKIGFRFEQRTLFQPGDPTKNALMLFTKI